MSVNFVTVYAYCTLCLSFCQFCTSCEQKLRILRFTTAQTQHQLPEANNQTLYSFAQALFLIYTKQSPQKSAPTKHPIG